MYEQIKIFGIKIIELYEALDIMYKTERENFKQEDINTIGKYEDIFHDLQYFFDLKDFEKAIILLQKIDYSLIIKEKFEKDKLIKWGFISNKIKDFSLQKIFSKISSNKKMPKNLDFFSNG